MCVFIFFLSININLFLHLLESTQWQSSKAGGDAPINVLRFYNFLASNKVFKGVINKFPGAVVKEKKARGAEPVVCILPFYV